MTEDSLKFEYEFIVDDTLLDEYGHVNNAHYLRLYEQARWKILEMNDMGEDTIRINHIGPIILEVTVRFRKEITAGEKIRIETRSRRKNDLVFYFDQEMITEQGEIANKAVFTAALFDVVKRKMVRPDEKWLKAFGFQN